ncbi:hypothetical protein E1281_36825 [Actinomadura sp. KC345]|uniref:hypothetical protein n=1 Tax=Actinomadura sp. KC345 TaxID=2530371 RepID=UPI00104F84F9|nr:hypothetical protein [Actinomadura sp. KC345]TDC41921.1 hypothetical protein E1281_36825 [Actinomadura sp. KC345]
MNKELFDRIQGTGIKSWEVAEVEAAERIPTPTFSSRESGLTRKQAKRSAMKKRWRRSGRSCGPLASHLSRPNDVDPTKRSAGTAR